MSQALTFDLARPWRTHPRETVGLGVLGLVAAIALAGSAASTNRLPSAEAVRATPAALPAATDVRPVDAQTALQLNAKLPFATGPNPAARPFSYAAAGAETRARALECLTSAIYYEAGQEPLAGQQGVAQVVLNRVRHPAFPASVCGVVYQGSTRSTGCQFTFTCDGSLYRQPDAEGWRRAYRIAEEALAGSVYAPVGYATHYHANYVVPYWTSTLAKNAVVGAHMFYRWAGGWGQPGAFVKAYAGREPNARALRTAALAVPHVTPSYQQGEVAEAIKDIPGAEAIKITPSLRGDKRVGVRFNLEARKASEEAVHEDYTKKFEASDNLKWSLSSATVASNEKPLGKTEAPAAATGAAAQR